MQVLPFSLVVVGVLTIAAPVTADAPSFPITITTSIDFTSFPFHGTFTVDDPNGALGCDAGSFMDAPHGFGAIEKHFMCTSGGSGTFVVVFRPNPNVPGPGDQNGRWNVLTGTGDFAGLRGSGEFSVVFTAFDPNGFPTTGQETLAGFMHFQP